jgi:polar amino acid transport system substrate-binding protein
MEAFYPIPCHAEGRPVVIHAMSNDPWVPYYQYEKDNQDTPKGLFIELTETLMSQELGLQIKQLLVPWKRAQEAVETGTADFMITIQTPARALYSVASEVPIHKMYLHLFTYAHHPKALDISKIQTVDDIKKLDLTLVAHRGDGWHKANIASKGITVHYVNKDEQLPQFVAAKRADGMIDAALPMADYIYKYELQDKVTRTKVRFGPLAFHILISRKSPLLNRIDEINAAIKRLEANGTLEKLAAKYDKQPH